MDKKARVNVWMEDALNVSATLNDFDGDVQKWKLTFYELWRYQMTWHFAYRISVHDRRNGGVYVCILCKPAYEKNIVETMESLGYRNIIVEHENIGTIECTDLPEDMLIDFVDVDY